MNLPEIENNAKGVTETYKQALKEAILNQDEILLASMKGLYGSLVEHYGANSPNAIIAECVYRCCYLALYAAKLELFIEDLPTPTELEQTITPDIKL